MDGVCLSNAETGVDATIMASVGRSFMVDACGRSILIHIGPFDPPMTLQRFKLYGLAEASGLELTHT